MRALIIYASRHGQTEKICTRIARILRNAGAEVLALHVRKLPRDLQLETFDLVLVAAPVYFARHAKAIEAFVRANRAGLDAVRNAFVSVSGAAAKDRAVAEENVRLFVERTGWTPRRVELVAGGEPYTRYGLITKWIMTWKMKQLGRIVDPSRDYEYTDWHAVEAFAHDLANIREPELALM